MSDKENKDDVTESSNETNTEQVIEAETVNSEKTASENDTKTNKFNNDVLTRILVTLLFALIGWVSLWVFAVVVLVQFGFLLITGHANKNLKAFGGEMGQYLSDIIKYVGFQTEQKPFPFQGWHYDDKNTKNGEPAK
ncbi:DUF4389 domain-containing protein [Marinicella sp. S1101]|uniref:DUF4389 domain-containing protein n=1 Tax=Marinicella marina TaxID=2996016 RepID=UPI002260EB03|nr:DUF4389 domain-containing protein [Marinicella marina]MCX7554315.1 DUF4389 domain-containing protein [Marinicella marina]MDJ1138694.1 DUF4389 domain-containing protein [Marinicella marina]